MPNPLPASALFLLLALPVAAQQAAPGTCAAAGSKVARMVCQSPELSALDQALAQRFHAAEAAAKAQGGPQAVARLRGNQRGWLGWRDQCWKVNDVAACIEDAYLRREGELVAAYALDPPAGTATWTCTGGLRLQASYFATDLPAIRLRWADRIEIGSQAISASGVRYELAFGTQFWEKGDQARFSDRGAPEALCTRTD